MPTQIEKINTFRDLHQAAQPLVLVNVWDSGSAKIVAASGAPALATGSASVGGALGFGDGEAVPLSVVLQIAARIAASVDVPVSIDFEAGYAAAPEGVFETVAALIAAGAAGLNLEDGYPAGDGAGVRPMAAAARRIAAARAAADTAWPGFWINARTDVCLQTKPEAHADVMPGVIARARAYAEAGADSFFVPGLKDMELIRSLCAASPLPVNIMAGPEAAGFGTLAAAGVRRISYGPFPWRAAMQNLASFAACASAPGLPI
jgi:2-methylisocitrate lyase-like PEP mutase family enzyme